MIHHRARARQRALLAASLAIILTLVACTGSDEGEGQAAPVGGACEVDAPADEDQPSDEITVLTAFGNVLGREGYVYVADTIGAFDAQHLDVTIEPGVPQTNTESIVGGSAHFAAVDSSGVLIRAGLGTETQSVIVSAVQQQPTASLISLDVTSPFGLEGATIGAVEGPAITEVLFPTYAGLVGFDPETVTWEHMGQPDLIPALVAGRVDAIALFLMSQPTVSAAAGREALVEPYSEYLADLFGTVYVANRDLVASNPDLVRRFNEAVTAGLVCAVERPDFAGQVVADAVEEANPDDVAAELEAMAPYVRGDLGPDEPVGAVYRPKLARAIKLLQGYGLYPPGLDPEDVAAFDVIPGGGQ